MRLARARLRACTTRSVHRARPLIGLSIPMDGCRICLICRLPWVVITTACENQLRRIVSYRNAELLARPSVPGDAPAPAAALRSPASSASRSCTRWHAYWATWCRRITTTAGACRLDNEARRRCTATSPARRRCSRADRLHRTRFFTLVRQIVEHPGEAGGAQRGTRRRHGAAVRRAQPRHGACA